MGVRVCVGVGKRVGANDRGVAVGDGPPTGEMGVGLLVAIRLVTSEVTKRIRARENPLTCLGTKVLLHQRGDIYLGVLVQDGEEVVCGA